MPILNPGSESNEARYKCVIIQYFSLPALMVRNLEPSDGSSTTVNVCLPCVEDLNRRVRIKTVLTDTHYFLEKHWSRSKGLFFMLIWTILEHSFVLSLLLKLTKSELRAKWDDVLWLSITNHGYEFSNLITPFLPLLVNGQTIFLKLICSALTSFFFFSK